MRKKRRRRNKKRGIVVSRISSFIQTYDPEHLVTLGIISTIIVSAVGWWTEGGDKAVLGSIFIFFLFLSLSAGVRTFSLVYGAVKGVFDREDLFHAVVKLSVIGIALIVMEDHTWFIVKVSIGGISFISFIMCLTIVSKVVSSWFKN